MAYTDMTSGYFSYKALLPYQYLNLLADNDAFDHLASGTKMVFPQSSAPIGWIRNEDVNDAFLRVVDSWVGSGGTDAVSTGLTVAHTHTTSAHSHTGLTHTHDMDYETGTAGIGTNIVITDGTQNDRLFSAGAGGNNLAQIYSRTVGATPSIGNASPDTDEQLSDTIFKYYDAIYCTKG